MRFTAFTTSYLLIEFVEANATLALCTPYALRSRFIFAAAHLCHQANQARDRVGWRDDFPLDTEIYLDVADKFGKPWKRYGKFKHALQDMANKKYSDETGDFRSKFNHRFSPHIEIGLTELVVRTAMPGGRVSYGFGSRPPLRLATVVLVLKEQLSASRRVFAGFQALVGEHAKAIQKQPYGG
jgi:hypothetical protein